MKCVIEGRVSEDFVPLGGDAEVGGGEVVQTCNASDTDL